MPVIPQTAQPPGGRRDRRHLPTIDGIVADGEWDSGGYYPEEGGVQANPNQVVSQLWYGFDKDSFFLRMDARRDWADVGPTRASASI